MGAKMIYEIEDAGIVAQWHGGEYIELGYYDFSYDSNVPEFVARDVINVWDYKNSSSRIPFTLEAMTVAVDDYVNDVDHEQELEDSLYEYIEYGEPLSDDAIQAIVDGKL